MTKTTLQFEPSPDADRGHMVRVVIGRTNQQQFRLDPGVTEITVESNYDPTDPSKSDHVMVFVSAIQNRNGTDVFSKARLFEFITTNEALPLPPGELVMKKVVPGLNVIQQTASEPQPTRLMVSGHAELYDGSVGTVNKVVGGGPNSNFPNGVGVTFLPNTLRAGGTQNKIINFYPGDPSINLLVIMPDGSQVPLDVYLQGKSPTA